MLTTLLWKTESVCVSHASFSCMVCCVRCAMRDDVVCCACVCSQGSRAALVTSSSSSVRARRTSNSDWAPMRATKARWAAGVVSLSSLLSLRAATGGPHFRCGWATGGPHFRCGRSNSVHCRLLLQVFIRRNEIVRSSQHLLPCTPVAPALLPAACGLGANVQHDGGGPRASGTGPRARAAAACCCAGLGAFVARRTTSTPGGEIGSSARWWRWPPPSLAALHALVQKLRALDCE